MVLSSLDLNGFSPRTRANPSQEVKKLVNRWNSPGFRSRSNSLASEASSDGSTSCSRVTPKRIIFERNGGKCVSEACQNKWRCTCKVNEPFGCKDTVANVVQKDDIEITVDLHNYQPHELQVKVVDNFVVVEGQSGNSDTGSGCVVRNFERKYNIPEDYNAEKISSTMTQDGVLKIRIPPKEIYEYVEVPVTQNEQPKPNILRNKKLPWK